MRNFKRFLSMALTMLMLVGSLSVLTSAKFEDVTDFQNEIAVLGQLGVIKGNADGTFGFDENVTRRQAALFFARATTGKVDDALNWQSTVNNTPFTDLDEKNDYYGAISYNHNMGIVKGRNATTFAPNDTITFQEAITMAVRALGYKGADMDAGYPYSYYSKAVSLGLDNGIEGVALTDTVTRGVMAKLIYNMIFATNSKGTTIAAEAFGSSVKTTSLVLVATDGKTLVKNLSTKVSDNKKLAAFVGFNNDGTFNLDTVYHFEWADFAKLTYGEGTTEKAIDHVGASYTVVTIDNFKSLVTATENKSEVLTGYNGTGKIGDKEYSLVQKWTSVANIGKTVTGNDELIQFNTAYLAGGNKIGSKVAYYGNNWYVVDENNNILKDDEGGSILLYYIDAIKDKDNIVTGASSTFPYYTKFEYKVGNDTVVKYYPAYLPLDGSRYNGAAPTDRFYADKNAATYDADKTGDKYTKNVSAYTDTVVYDDNGDGVYDRAYFTAYNFGQYIVADDDGNGKKEYHFTFGTLGKGSGKKYDTNKEDLALYNLTDEELKSGDFILWAYDPINNAVTVKKVYNTVKTGYVTGLDVVNDTITIVNNLFNYGLPVTAGETLKYGVDGLPGATSSKISGVNAFIHKDENNKTTEELVGVKYDLYGKAVTLVIDEEYNRVVAIVDVKSADTPLVITKVDISLYTLGTLRATVIDNSGNRQIISISSINGVPVLNWFNFNKDTLKEGQLVLGSQQKDGTWIVSTAVSYTEELESSDDDVTYTYVNGYGYNGTTLVHKADGSKLVIVNAVKTTTVDKDDKVISVSYSYQIASGVPANGSTITVTAPAKVYYKDAYMYILSEVTQKVGGDGKTTVTAGKKAAFTGNWNVIDSGWQVGLATDVIYLAARGVATTGNQYGTYLFTGNYFSILTGAKNTDVGSALYSNFMLEAGNFYHVTKVKDGDNTIVVVLDKIEDGYENTEYFKEVYVKSYNKDNRVITIADQYGKDIDTIKGKEPKYIDWKESTPSVDKAPKSKGDNQLYKAYYYYKEPLYGTTDKVYFLVTDTVNILSNPKLVGIEVEPAGNPVAGTTVKVKSVTIEINGTKVSYKPSELPFPAIYYWYSVENNEKKKIDENYNKTSYTTTKDDVGKTIRVEVYLPGYEGTASYDFENIIEYRLISLTVMADDTTVVDNGGQVAKNAKLTISKVTDMLGADVKSNCSITWTLNNNDNDVVGDSITLDLEEITGLQSGDAITVTVTCKGSTLKWTATVTG